MKTVLFACVHNAGRSQMAAAWFNLLADPERARATSAGTSPAAAVHPEVAAAMREVGIDLSSAPKLLTSELAAEAQLLVTMGCGDQCPVVPGAKRDDWPLDDPKGKPAAQVRAIRDEIHDRVLNLIQAEGWSRTAATNAPTIRLASESDAAAIAAIYRPVVESTPISFETEPPDEQEMRRRISETLRTYAWLVHERGGDVVGFAYASQHRTRAAYRWSVDTSAYVDERYRRRRIGQGLYTSLFAILAAQGFVNAYAGITLPNPASVALHERVGFSPIGVYRNVGYKLGAWRDVGWWERSLRAHDSAPPPAQSLDNLRKRQDWEALLLRGLPIILG